MKIASYPQYAHSTCPYDCPSTYALDANTIGFCVMLADTGWVAGPGVSALESVEPGLSGGGAIYHHTAVWLRAAGTSL